MESDKITILPCNQVSARDAAKFLGVSERTLANWRALGLGPKSIKRGKRGRVFYPMESLQAYANGIE